MGSILTRLAQNQDPKLRALADAWRAYDRAQLGELNRTAEALRDAAKAAGWRWGRDVALNAWVKATLQAGG